MKTKIIGFGHYSRVGKDTIANSLVKIARKNGVSVKKVPFARKLKQVCYALYAWAGLKEAAFYDTVAGAKFRHIKLAGIPMTPVQIWVAMGTDAIRQNVYDRTWIDCVLKVDHGVDLLIVPDVRFLNEVLAIKEADGSVYKIERPGYTPLKTLADQELLDYEGWDRVIRASDVSELEAAAEILFKQAFVR